MPVSCDAFSSTTMRLFPKGWDSTDNALSKDWSPEVLWVHPPNQLWPQVAQKLVLDGCRGIAVLPTCKRASWWWLMGGITVDWVEVPKGTPLFTDMHGRVLRCNRPYRIVHFDAYDHKQVSPSSKRQVYNKYAEPLRKLHTDSESEDDCDSQDSENYGISDELSESGTDDEPRVNFVLSDVALPRHERQRGRRHILKRQRRSGPHTPLSHVEQFYGLDRGHLRITHCTNL